MRHYFQDFEYEFKYVDTPIALLTNKERTLFNPHTDKIMLDLRSSNYNKKKDVKRIRYRKMNEWKWLSNNYQSKISYVSYDFIPRQTEEPWMKDYLISQEPKFVSYLKRKHYRPQNLTQTRLIELRKKYNQNWLKIYYPNKRKTTEIWIDKLENLHGKLIIANYPQLETIEISYQNNLTNLQINNCPKLKELTVYDSQLNNLDLTSCSSLEELILHNNSFSSLELANQKKLKKLDVSGNNLINLNINHLKDLEELNVSSNNLTELNTSNLVNLEEFRCSNNRLTDLDLSQNLGLKYLDISRNNFNQDLSFLKDLVNLKELWLGNWNENKIQQNIYNRFKGSLEPLKNMSKLNSLDINNTDIDSGLEYLPESVCFFNCLFDKEKYAECKSILKLFANEQGIVKIDEWGIKSFHQKLKDYKQWKRFSFSDEEIKSWLLIDSKFTNYLKQKNYHPNTPNIKEIIKKESWLDINPNFDYSTRKKWENKNFDKKQAQEWIGAGFKPSDYNYPQNWKKHNFTDKQTQEWARSGAKADDYKFVVWLRDIKKYGSEWITNYKEDYELLSKRFKKYGLCSECNQPNTGEKWCKSCNKTHLFAQPVSNNPEINEFILNYQLDATDADKFLEWIPYEEFYDIEYLAQGGFGKVYKAKWMEGNISYWDTKNSQWQREKDHYFEEEKNSWGGMSKVKKSKPYREVVLKSLSNSSENIDFLKETEKHKIIDDWFNNIVPCYGLSQEPQTGNYLMVMKYIEGGNLRQYLNNNKNLTFQDKLKRLTNIIQGLKDVHSKNLVHRDFHSGNILNSDIHSFITDLGLCKPADEVNKEDEIFGVLPYVAPEVLRKKGYTPASDIYSLGMVAYEIFANASPYLNKAWDISLSVEICKGLRPDLEEIKIPPMLKDLIKQCWDSEPTKRPTANEIERTLRNWQQEDSNFRKQIQVIEAKYNQMFQNAGYKSHPTATMNSKLINTKEITKLLSQSQEASSSVYLKETSDLDSCIISAEENLASEQTPQIIHNPQNN